MQELGIVLEYLKKAADLLKDRNTYYAIILGFLAYWIWSKDQTISEIKAENKTAIASLEKDKDDVQSKLDNKDCAAEIKAYKELLDGLQISSATKLEEQKKSAELERQRTVELENTYQQLVNK